MRWSSIFPVPQLFEEADCRRRNSAAKSLLAVEDRHGNEVIASRLAIDDEFLAAAQTATRALTESMPGEAEFAATLGQAGNVARCGGFGARQHPHRVERDRPAANAARFWCGSAVRRDGDQPPRRWPKKDALDAADSMLLFGIGSLDFRDDAGVPAMLFPHEAPEPGRKIVASARLN